jgi:hypothetical protein
VWVIILYEIILKHAGAFFQIHEVKKKCLKNPTCRGMPP